MKVENKSRRFKERLPLSLQVLIRCRESAQYEWSERSQLMDVSPSGARLTVTHKIEAGQLMRLTMAMPASMRSYDHNEKDYQVWAVVRNVVNLPMVDSDTPQYEIGVAFVGKNPPGGYQLNPDARYELRPAPDKNGLWVLRERERVKNDWD